MTLSLLLGTGFLLAAVGLFLALRSPLHPAVVITLAWGVTLSAAALVEPLGYYGISSQSCAIFAVGVASFVAATAPFSRCSPTLRSIDPFARFNYTRIAWCIVLIHAVMIPMSYAEAIGIAAGADDVYAAAYTLRASSVSGEERVGPLVGNYLLSGLLFVPLLFVGWRKREIKGASLVLLGAPWIVLNLVILGRSSLFVLAFSLIYIHFALGGRVSLRVFLLFGAVVFTVAVAGNLLVSKISATADDPLIDILSESAMGFFNYFVQGPILFSEYLAYRYKVVSTWDAFIFPCQILEKFDLCQVPTRHQTFLHYSAYPDGLGNVYSMFFAIYPKYGWSGLLLISALYGAWAGFLHLRRYASFVWLLLSSLLFSAAVLSAHSDQFGSNLYFFLKILALSLVVSHAFKKT